MTNMQWGDIRSIAHQNPGKSTFRRVIQEVGVLPLPEERLQYILDFIVRWPDAIQRSVPNAWVRLFLLGESCPQALLCNHIALDPALSPTDVHQLLQNPAMRNVTSVSISPPASHASDFSSALLSAPSIDHWTSLELSFDPGSRDEDQRVLLGVLERTKSLESLKMSGRIRRNCLHPCLELMDELSLKELSIDLLGQIDDSPGGAEQFLAHAYQTNSLSNIEALSIHSYLGDAHAGGQKLGQVDLPKLKRLSLLGTNVFGPHVFHALSEHPWWRNLTSLEIRGSLFGSSFIDEFCQSTQNIPSMSLSSMGNMAATHFLNSNQSNRSSLSLYADLSTDGIRALAQQPTPLLKQLELYPSYEAPPKFSQTIAKSASLQQSLQELGMGYKHPGYEQPLLVLGDELQHHSNLKSLNLFGFDIGHDMERHHLPGSLQRLFLQNCKVASLNWVPPNVQELRLHCCNTLGSGPDLDIRLYQGSVVATETPMTVDSIITMLKRSSPMQPLFQLDLSSTITSSSDFKRIIDLENFQHVINLRFHPLERSMDMLEAVAQSKNSQNIRRTSPMESSESARLIDNLPHLWLAR